MKQCFKVLVGVLIGAVFLFLMLRHEHWDLLRQDLEHINFMWVVFAFLSFALALLTRAQRWDSVLRPSAPHLSKSTSYKVFLICMAANAIFPLRIGDIMRGTVFAKSLGIPPIKAITSVLVEKLFDLVVVCTLGCALFYYFPINDGKLIKHGGPILEVVMKLGSPALGAITLFVLSILLGAHYLRGAITFVLQKIASILPSLNKILGFVEVQMHHVCDALAMINSKASFFKIAFWSILTWTLEGVTFYLVALAFPSITNSLAAWVAMPIAAISTAIPGAPGGIGAFDFFAESMMHLWGNPVSAATVYTFVLHLVILSGQASLGLIAWLFSGSLTTKKDIKSI